MKTTKLNLGIALAVIFLGAFVLGAFYIGSHPDKVSANPAEFLSPCQTAASRTGDIYLTAGRATTTLSCTLGGDDSRAVESAALKIEYAASSSPLSQLSIQFQWSDDNSNWYNDVGSATVATTTKYIDDPETYLYSQYASTTDPITGSTVATSTAIIPIPNPNKAKYTRAIFTQPIGRQNGALWAEIIPTKEAY